jgi:hypothetical protein
MHLTYNLYCQEEVYGIPFAAGIAPNWQAWGTAEKLQNSAFEQGMRYGEILSNKPFRTLLTLPYYQIINSPDKGDTHGIYRKFLGLRPGHTYRLTACVSTLEMNSMKEDWSFSIHAAPTQGDLTAQQMAGRDPLPYPGSPSKDWMMAYYDPNQTTLGFDFAITNYTRIRKDVLNSSQSMPEDANQVVVPNITLPSDVNEITVWTRFQCDDPAGKVGFSGLRLEDITSMENVMSPGEMIKLEYQREQEFLKQEADLERRFNNLF